MLTEEESKVIRKKLSEARYGILVSLRPISPARSAFNITLLAIARALGDDTLYENLHLPEGL